ncbi:hypothetical protein [Halothiobacillus diazotrophicus]|nr:hypothetical protein [Halothiobacillus diazotrophicus]
MSEIIRSRFMPNAIREGGGRVDLEALLKRSVETGNTGTLPGVDRAGQ